MYFGRPVGLRMPPKYTKMEPSDPPGAPLGSQKCPKMQPFT